MNLPRRTRPHAASAPRHIAAMAVCLAAGCSPDGGDHVIPEVRDLSEPRGRLARIVTEAERFGGTAHQRPPSQPGQGGFRFDLPPGWRERAPSQMRLVDVTVDGRDEVECYLSVLPGTGGGLLANVNRWRAQVGLDAIGPAELESLPKHPLLGAAAAWVHFEGTYSGMGGTARSDWALAGLIAEGQGQMVFLKMTGPAPDVAAELDHLKRFATSLQVESGGPDTATGGDNVSGAIGFDAPAGWVEGGERPMRLVTLHPGGDERVECYVTVLGGEGGGLPANLNRWRSQFGAAPLTDAEIDALPRVAVLGQNCPLLEVEGPYVDMSGRQNDRYALLGTVRLLPQAALFVKMVGPAETVAAERDRFQSFCESLRF